MQYEFSEFIVVSRFGLNFKLKTVVTINLINLGLNLGTQGPRKNVQLVNRPSENTTTPTNFFSVASFRFAQEQIGFLLSLHV